MTDELNAIRARVDEQDAHMLKVEASIREHFGTAIPEDISSVPMLKLISDCRRYIAMVEERDEEILATNRVCEAYAATSEERFDELESLRRELAEARGKAIKEAERWLMNVSLEEKTASAALNQQALAVLMRKQLLAT